MFQPDNDSEPERNAAEKRKVSESDSEERVSFNETQGFVLEG